MAIAAPSPARVELKTYFKEQTHPNLNKANHALIALSILFLIKTLYLRRLFSVLTFYIYSGRAVRAALGCSSTLFIKNNILLIIFL
jgi:hypothetical protein